MFDLVTFGDITIDLFFKGDSLTEEKDRFHLAIGGKYSADMFYESLGGGGANVAAGVASYGYNTAVYGRVGNNPFKHMILQKLLAKHVSQEFLVEADDYLNLSSILLAKSGDKTAIHYVSKKAKLHLDEKYQNRITQTKMVYMGNMPDTALAERIRILQLYKKHNVDICLNIGNKDCELDLKEIMPLIDLSDIFIVNTHEFAQLSKKDIKKIDFKKDCAKLLDLKKTTLVITDGLNGSYCYNNKKIYFQKAIDKGVRVDATGAGDAFCAGFIAAYLEGKSIDDAMHQASEYAGNKVTHIGAQ